VKGHVELDGKAYLIQDQSYRTQTVPLFRPQLVVQGISHEALDQYLYQVWGTWNKGTNRFGILGRWAEGTYRSSDGVDQTETGRLRLQKDVTLVLPKPTNVSGRLIAVGDYLYVFWGDGTVERTNDGTTWSPVTYGAQTYGAVTCVALASVGTPFIEGEGPTSSVVAVIAGTDKGYVWTSKLGDPIAPAFVTIVQDNPRINFVASWRNSLAFGYAENFEVWAYTGGLVIGPLGTFSRRYRAVLPGTPVTAEPFQGGLVVASPAAQRGTVLHAADTSVIADTYTIGGDFQVGAMTTWGGSLLLCGERRGVEGQVYQFPEKLVERLPTEEGVPRGIFAAVGLAEYALVGWNAKGGLWWIGPSGGGPFAQYPVAYTNGRIVTSIAVFNGEIYYALKKTGVLRVSPSTYKTSGRITSGWFDGGFPELTKNWSEVSVRLDAPLAPGESVTISGRVDDDSAFTTIGTMNTVGQTSAVFPVPTALQASRRFETRISLAGPGTSTPVVTSVVNRYRVVPLHKRLWAFTIKAASPLVFADGTVESRTPEQIIADVFALQNAGQITFRSALEPTPKTVYVTNVTMGSQLMGRTRPFGEFEEAHLGVEVLEV
jgi:hypothetical protein